jgi:integrase
MAENPAKLAGPNPQPKAEEIHPFTQAEIDLVAEELGPRYGPAVVFASETGMRPSEWLAIEWRDVVRKAGVVLVERTCAYGAVKAYGKTARSRRRVPLSTRALEALDAIPRRLDVRLVFPGKRGGVIDLKHFRRGRWKPALEAAGIPPRRIYDMRHSFATWALDAGLSTPTCGRQPRPINASWAAWTRRGGLRRTAGGSPRSRSPAPTTIVAA